MHPAASNLVASPGGSHLEVNLIRTPRKALKEKSFYARKNGVRMHKEKALMIRTRGKGVYSGKNWFEDVEGKDEDENELEGADEKNFYSGKNGLRM